MRMMGTALKKPSQINRNISGETEKIILKAMAIPPPERYSTAKEMNLEILEFLNSSPSLPFSNKTNAFRRDIRRS